MLTRWMKASGDNALSSDQSSLDLNHFTAMDRTRNAYNNRGPPAPINRAPPLKVDREKVSWPLLVRACAPR